MIWNFSWKICLFAIICLYHLIDHLFTSVWTHGYLFYTLGCNIMLLYLFCYSNCSSFCHWKLFSSAPTSLWHFDIIVCKGGVCPISLETFDPTDVRCQMQTDPILYSPLLLALGLWTLSLGCPSDHGRPQSCRTHWTLDPALCSLPQPLPCRNNALSPTMSVRPVLAPEKLCNLSNVTISSMFVNKLI